MSCLSLQGMKSGCTVVCCLVREQRHLYVGWVGDSQAMLARKGVALPLVNPHKPEREDERKRIEDLGGMVVMMGIWRVNGSLAVSRAIGDAEHKPYVISEPDVLSVELDGTEDFLVLGCDGLWDQLSPQDVMNRVYQAVLDDPDGAPYVSHALVQVARYLGSDDNITAIVVFLRDPHSFDSASLSQIVYCPALEETAVSELPTPPVGDSGNIFDSPTDDVVQVATGVVRETIESALHRVNDDAAAARDIVEQVHQIHSEQELGNFTDLSEHFYGAVPMEKGGDDGVLGPANGYVDGTVGSPGGRRNPFEDEGYERDVDAFDGADNAEAFHPEFDTTLDVAESEAAFLAENRRSHDELKTLDGHGLVEAFNVGQPSVADSSPAVVQEEFHDQAFQFGAPAVVQGEFHDQAFQSGAPDALPHLDVEPHLAENYANNVIEQPAGFQEHEYPDEGVDVGHPPEELQEQVPALSEQLTEGPFDQHILPDQADLCTEDQVQYVAPEHFGYATGEKEEVSSSPNLHQQMSVLSDDLVSIDLNASATQSLSDAVSLDIAGHIKQEVEAQSQEPNQSTLTGSIPEVQEETYPPAAAEMQASETLGVEDIEDLSPAGSAESVVEKVAAEAEQDSAVVFCQLKEAPVSEEQNLFSESQLNENVEEQVDNQTTAFTSQPKLGFVTEPWEQRESAVDDPHDIGDFGASNFYADRPSTLSTVPEDLHSFMMSQQLSPLNENVLQSSVEAKAPENETAQLPEPTADSQTFTPAADAEVTIQESTDFDSSSPQAAGPHTLPGEGVSPEASVPSGVESTAAVEQGLEAEVKEVALEETLSLKEDASCFAESSNMKSTSEEPSAPVDLGKIPENIPEADGVTEDSDSEKDGGWRFVKPAEPAKVPAKQVEEAPNQVEEAPNQVEEAPKPVEEAPKPVEVAPKQLEVAAKQSTSTASAAKRRTSAGTPKTGTAQPLTKRPSSATKASPATKTASPGAAMSTAVKKESTTPGKSQSPAAKVSTTATTTLAATRKPLVPASRPAATKPSTVPAATKTSAAPAAAKPSTVPKARPAPPSTLRAKPTAPAVTKSATAAVEKKTAAPARPPVTKTAPKPSAPSAPRTTSSAATSRPVASATARTGVALKVASTLAKKTVDTTAPRTTARPTAVRDTKQTKDTTNQQLSGTRKPVGAVASKTSTTRPATAASTLRNAAAAKANTAKAPAPKSSAAR
ncbi:unnamed protein product, partial [Ixodes hexagonus]